MKEKFKQRLKDYELGLLTDEEKAELEQELAKLEAYQEHLDEALSAPQAPMPKEVQTIKLNPKRERQLMRRGKWKARTWSAGTVIGLFLLASIINSVVISLFYDPGEPSRREVYRDVISSAFAISYPNRSFQGLSSSSSSTLLGVKFYGNIVKQIGNERVHEGDYSGKTFFNMMRTWDWNWNNNNGGYGSSFVTPDVNRGENASEAAWERLDKLPEGTVAEAYLSLNRLYTTDEILSLFKDTLVEPLWFAVYNGYSSDSLGHSQLGFPAYPLWHYEDETIIHQDKNSKSVQYPAISSDGDGELRNKNFIDTLKLLKKYGGMARGIVSGDTVDQFLEYVEENDVKIYGVVITGPTKQLLKLKEEPFVNYMDVTGVELWN